MLYFGLGIIRFIEGFVYMGFVTAGLRCWALIIRFLFPEIGRL